jgi:hypothetical protein
VHPIERLNEPEISEEARHLQVVVLIEVRLSLKPSHLGYQQYSRELDVVQSVLLCLGEKKQ